MILEMVGSRVLAPYLGSSIYTWTSLIGIIMGSLSIGYYYGGKIADKGATYKTLSRLILLAGILILITNLTKHIVLSVVTLVAPDIRMGSIIAGALLFVLPGVLLGMISPYAVKLRLANLSTTGSTVGNLYAISTLGSIVGTFLAGFYLISLFGTTGIIYILSITLILLSVFTYPKELSTIKFLIIFICVTFFYGGSSKLTANIKGLVDIDTDYNRVWIFPSVDKKSGKPTKVMNLNKQSASAIFLDSEELVYEYNKHFNLSGFFRPDMNSALLVGGAAYTYPVEFIKKFPNATLDVVEIDPALSELAKKYFYLKDSDRMKIYAEDGRVFLNKSDKKYNVVLMDVFNSHFSIPYHLTTVEAMQAVYNTLDDDGVVITNIISSVQGSLSGFYLAELSTYKKVFPRVLAFRVNASSEYELQNLILVGIKGDKEISLESENPELRGMLEKKIEGPLSDAAKVLTDDYAPIESFFNSSEF